MKKLLFLACTLCATVTSVNSQTAAAARAAGVGANVSVRGVAINGPELGIIRYVQDATGGVAAYGGNLSSINLGDSIVVSGTLTEYYNLYEITPATFILVSTNAKVPAPKVITPSQFGESHEGVLIRIKNCTFSATGNFPNTATNYTVTANSQTFAVRSNTALAGTPIPTGTVDIIGVGSQFCGPASSSGCTTGYQLLPRTTADIVASAGPATGIEENKQNKATLSVYPNPANSSISFNVSSYEKINTVVITDVLGKVVYTSKEDVHTVDVSAFSQGVYSISVSTERSVYQSKFVIE